MDELIQTIVKQSNELKNKYISSYDSTLGYCCIFAQNDEQYNDFENQVTKVGCLLLETRTGNIYKIDPIETVAGKLKALKIRRPDIARQELGHCDFKINNYKKFKDEYLSKANFKLIKRETFEMIELMDNEFNVRIYFPNEQYELLDKI